MAEFIVSMPDVWANRIKDAVNERALGIEQHFVVQKILAAWGKPTVADCTLKERAELICLFTLWNINAIYESENAKNEAYQQALQGNIDEFTP